MIEREERDGIVTLRMAHGKANALDVELCRDITEGLKEASSHAFAVVLTGTKSIFCAGVDLFRVTREGAPYVEKFIPELVDLLTTLMSFPRPIVAAINGHAIAGGCLITAAADYRVMSGGTIGVPELAVGVPFPAIAIEILRFATPAHASRLATTGQVMGADEALTRGLVDEVVPHDQLMSRAHSVAMRLAEVPPEAFRITKGHLREPFLREARERASEDRNAIRVWSDPGTHDHIKAYLQRTIGR